MLVLLVLLQVQVAIATSLFVVHEAREAPLENAIDRRRIEPQTWLPMRIGLKQNKDALANIEDWIMDVSDPNSLNFGRHWNQEDVVKAFQPSKIAVNTIHSWLIAHNISHATYTDNRQWLAFELKALQVEGLLHTEFYEHINPKTGRFETSTDRYLLPKDVSEHVDFIMPAIVAKDISGRSARSRRDIKELDARLQTRDALKTLSALNSDQTSSESAAAKCPPNDLTCCDVVVSPACLRKLYDFSPPDPNKKISGNNSLGLMELYSITLQSDLNTYFHMYTDIPNGTTPIYHAIDGAVTNIKQIQPFRKQYLQGNGLLILLGESTLDIDAAIPIIYPQNLTIFQENDPYWAYYDYNHERAGLFNSLLDAIDGSDCKFTAFNITNQDPKLDPIYPDTHNYPDSWRKNIQCGVFKPTNTLSLSYANSELDISFKYQQRQCLEFGKLAMQGVSVFLASGDEGVGPCRNRTGLFNVNEPEGCPWLTVVGASQVKKGNSINKPEVAAALSGGAFSNIFPRPQYQDEAVTEYFKNHDPGIPYYTHGNFRSGGKYNRDGRGYPDIAAIGRNVATIINGSYFPGDGTSASAPIVAALFTRINEERIKVGKGTVGFVNPTLYKNPQALNDILEGDNSFPGCDQHFTCVPGWEPVNGLGTPNYEKLLEVFMQLP